MVRTLIFLEVIVAVALAVLLPLVVEDYAFAVAAPLAFILLVPLIASLAVRPISAIRAALAVAFSSRQPAGDPREIQAILTEFGDYLRLAVALGAFTAISSALPKFGTPGRPEPFLVLGAWFALYGVLAALGIRILGLSVARLAMASPRDDEEANRRIQAFLVRYGVSAREWQVATCIAAGASYKETADRLFISLSTVKAHLSSVYRKTGARDKIELVLLLRREGC